MDLSPMSGLGGALRAPLGPVVAALVPRYALLPAPTPRLITRDADLAEGVEQGICGPTEQVVDGDGKVVGADLGRQAGQQSPIGACAWELQPSWLSKQL